MISSVKHSEIFLQISAIGKPYIHVLKLYSFFFFFKCKAEIIKASFEIPKEGIQLGRYLPHPGWSVSLESFVPQQSLCSCSVHSVLFACTGMVELGNSTE